MDTPFFSPFKNSKDYSTDLCSCIEETVIKLLSPASNETTPGMLIGNIQSGKTRAFIGIIALAFDKGFDIAVVLTKGTKVLTQQTYQRLEKVFERQIEEDLIKLYDILKIPENLTTYILNQKLLIVSKKEKNNIIRLLDLFDKYNQLKNKRLLIIDDEADYASIGFKRNTQQDEISLNVIASQIDQVRSTGESKFLQVTATPYSLYLQPEHFELNGQSYHPLRPSFTVEVPIHKGYIGSKYYFEESENPISPAHYLHVDIPDTEISCLGRIDQRYLHNIETTKNLLFFRQAIIDFIVGGTIRRLQEPNNYKCSFIFHTETSKVKHQWQNSLASKFLDYLETLARVNRTILDTLIEASLNRFKTIESLPNHKDIMGGVTSALIDGYIGINTINSDKEIMSLLDKKGQLKLDNPFNIFIGGQILDRGITIENLIGFYYGRNPRNFQLDTVQQHSRMYGYRSEKDLHVTRFYTTSRIYNAMKRMHFIDSSLRDAFFEGRHNDGVVFLEVDKQGQIKHCAPNKILISSTETIRPFRRFLPRGMKTKSKSTVNPLNNTIERILSNNFSNLDNPSPTLISKTDCFDILENIIKSYDFDEIENKWDLSTIKAIIDQLTFRLDQNKCVHCIVRIDRNSSRLKANNTFNDAPDDGRTDRPLAKQIAKEEPCLQLFKQNGYKENGWSNTPFWWPILVCPENTKTSVFTADTV